MQFAESHSSSHGARPLALREEFVPVCVWLHYFHMLYNEMLAAGRSAWLDTCITSR